ncbi:glycosyltransferase family 4 protein [Micromonospora wenchangensis]|uniref:glycosyltransferase family 4 protein n=1 Tax=Micromonospora wenchangensis TaxID=1185415 RepID=UPI0038188575
MNVALVLLTHNPDEPAGVERGIASLADGLRELGHRAIIIAAGPPTAADGPDTVRLKTLTLSPPVVFDDVNVMPDDPDPLRQEVLSLMTEHEIDVACWTDAGVGLGYLGAAPPGVRTALMVYFLRVDEPMAKSLALKPDAVISISDFLIDEAARAGLDSAGWHSLPNALLCPGNPPDHAAREQLRQTGPVRILARADPSKGVADLLRAYPEGFGRRVEIVLGEAAFELWPGMQRDMIAECRQLAATLPDVEILPAIPWTDAQPFLGGASVVLVPSTSPETFCNVAAEALSMGTPVVGYGFGHLPVLVGEAGRIVSVNVVGGFGHLPALTGAALEMIDLDSGPARLWRATADLLADRDTYHRASRQAPRQVATQTPAAVAEEFLRITMGAA